MNDTSNKINVNIHILKRNITADLTLLIQLCNVDMIISNVRINVMLRRVHLTTAAMEKK
jgi:hypothetical protein